jgi:hypothetical protein
MAQRITGSPNDEAISVGGLSSIVFVSSQLQQERKQPVGQFLRQLVLQLHSSADLSLNVTIWRRRPRGAFCEILAITIIEAIVGS